MASRIQAVVPGLSLLILTVAFAGCVKSKVVVYVNPDGSGHLVVSRLFDQATVVSVEALHARPDAGRQVGDADSDDADDATARKAKQPVDVKPREPVDTIFDEKALRQEANTYGTGVKLVRAQRLDADGGRGFIAVYSFKDINDVFIAPDVKRLNNVLHRGIGNPSDPFAAPDDAEDDGGSEGGRRGKQGVEFSFQTGAVSRLKILMPTADLKDEEEIAAREDDGEDTQSVVAKDAMEWLSGGMRRGAFGRNLNEYYGYQSGLIALGLDVVINGTVVASGAAYTNVANRNRIVLLDLDASRRDPTNATPVADYGLRYSYGSGRIVKNIMEQPCTIIETNREIVVEFR